MRARKKEIPKDGGKRVRVLSIPTITSTLQWRPEAPLETSGLTARA
jgi:hypothetical protein